MQHEFNHLHSNLQFKFNCIDFAHIPTIFLSSNDNLLKTYDSILHKNFKKPLMENKPKQDPQKVIFYFSKVSITEAEKPLSVKGLSFLLLPK